MPRRLECAPQKLEDQCIYVYLNYLHDEMNLIFHLKNYREKSVLLKQHGLEPDFLISRLQCQLSNNLAGILQDIVRQKRTYWTRWIGGRGSGTLVPIMH